LNHFRQKKDPLLNQWTDVLYIHQDYHVQLTCYAFRKNHIEFLFVCTLPVQRIVHLNFIVIMHVFVVCCFHVISKSLELMIYVQVMPLSGFLISKLLNLPSYYAAGLILVSCCPGGTASNIVTYLARGNVALSVLMTAASTFAAAFLTPLLTSKLAGQYVAVDPMGLFVSTSQVLEINLMLYC
jgi:hypothetical protein